MALLSIREYGKLSIGDFDLAKPSVSPAQAAQLRSLKQLHGFDVFKMVNESTLSAQQYVGTVQIGSLTVEILPKVEGIDGTAMRRNLIAMLAVVLDLDISEGDKALVASQRNGILEILIRLFCDKLFSQVHKGIVRRYEPRAENLPVLRGRIGIAEQIRFNAAHPERLFCRFDEFQEDNPLNQVFKACLRLLFRVSQDLSNQRQLSELLLAFEGVSDISKGALSWHLVTFDRLNQRFEATFKLAELFLRSTPPDVSGGGVHGYSLLFDMNTLFEEYIGRIARRVFRPEGYRVILQGPQQCLTHDEIRDRGAFALKPDVVGLRGKEAAWIIDTKWKQLSAQELRDGVSQADIYQMYAYSNRYVCPDVMLLYPHHQGLGVSPGIRGNYRLNSWFGSKEGDASGRIRIGTIDLENLATIPQQLRTLILGIPSACSVRKPFTRSQSETAVG